MEYDLNTLNDEQMQALKQIEGAVLVTAGAGSGKTRLLTHRIAYLIKELGESPYSILAITFTNKASKEMKTRICDMVENADKVWISTFHSMCVRILRQDITLLPPYTKEFTIYSESDSEKVVKKVLETLNFKDEKFKKVFTYHLSAYKNSGQSLPDYLNSHACEFPMTDVGKAIVLYDDYLKKNNALDFDDLLLKTIELFKTNPQVLFHYSNRFRYILVDEFQDTNTVQYNLVKMLASEHGNIFVVGDEDQCIYSWRGANFQNIFNFKKDFKDVKVFKLERNYRSSESILQVANNVIKNNTSRLDKNMWTKKQGGDKPVLYNAYDERDEALFVAQNIERFVLQGYNYDDIAVLMRINALSRSFEEAFLSYNIPHRIYGGFKFYERAEIKNLISYLRIFVNPKDDISFARIINVPKRGIGDGTLAKLEIIGQGKSFVETLLDDDFKQELIYKKFEDFASIYKDLQVSFNGCKISEFVENVINKFSLKSMYNPSIEEDLNKILNIEQFVSSVKDYEALNPDASLSEFLEMITLSSDADEIGQGGAVTIATVHAVKGLEFKVVFIIGLEEGVFPISRAFNSNHELEEERRLMYVAITRAEEKLFMSHCSKRYLYQSSQYQMPSRFCRELGLLSFEKPKEKKLFDFVSNSNYSQSYDCSKEKFNNGCIINKEQFFKKEEKERKDVSIYKVGQKVSHPRFGEGEIVSISEDGLVGDIIFEDFGKKSLMLELAPLEIL